MTLSRELKIKTLMAVVTVGFAAATLFYYVMGTRLGAVAPYNTYLPAFNFGDFGWLTSGWHDSQFAGTGYGHVYFPAAYLAIDPFTRIIWSPFLSYHVGKMLAELLFDSIVSGFIFILALQELKSTWPPESLMRATVCTFMSYPVLFTLVTANFEGILFIALVLFAGFYQAGRIGLSLPFLGFCIAMKGMPAIYGVLLLADRQYRALLMVALWTLLFTLLPLMLFHGGLRDGLLPWFQHMHDSQKMYYNLMAVSRAGNHFGHSLLNAGRVLVGEIAPLPESFMWGYGALGVICFAGMFLYVVKVEGTFWKRFALLACAECLLPYTSTDYKLLHFYVPMFFFINSDGSDEYDLRYVMLFGLLMIPKSYLTLHHLDNYTSNGVLNAAIMVMLAVTIISGGLSASVQPSLTPAGQSE